MGVVGEGRNDGNYINIVYTLEILNEIKHDGRKRQEEREGQEGNSLYLEVSENVSTWDGRDHREMTSKQARNRRQCFHNIRGKGRVGVGNL